MFERFTDRSRKVMQLATQEAQRLNHEYVGTEHLLLGLIKEGYGIAAHVLKNLNIDVGKIRAEVEKVVQIGPADAFTMGRLPLTPRTKRTLECAIEEATALGHNYVGTEHLLLGLLREENTVAFQILKNFGIDIAKVREEIILLIGPRESRPVPATSVMAQAFKAAIEVMANPTEQGDYAVLEQVRDSWTQPKQLTFLECLSGIQHARAAQRNAELKALRYDGAWTSLFYRPGDYFQAAILAHCKDGPDA